MKSDASKGEEPELTLVVGEDLLALWSPPALLEYLLEEANEHEGRKRGTYPVYPNNVRLNFKSFQKFRKKKVCTLTQP